MKAACYALIGIGGFLIILALFSSLCPFREFGIAPTSSETSIGYLLLAGDYASLPGEGLIIIGLVCGWAARDLSEVAR
jgi:hypothetical protein